MVTFDGTEASTPRSVRAGVRKSAHRRASLAAGARAFSTSLAQQLRRHSGDAYAASQRLLAGEVIDSHVTYNHSTMGKRPCLQVQLSVALHSVMVTHVCVGRKPGPSPQKCPTWSWPPEFSFTPAPKTRGTSKITALKPWISPGRAMPVACFLKIVGMLLQVLRAPVHPHPMCQAPAARPLPKWRLQAARPWPRPPPRCPSP